MAYENQIKCPGCGISVPDVPEDATIDEMLCNKCYEEYELSNQIPQPVIKMKSDPKWRNNVGRKAKGED